MANKRYKKSKKIGIDDKPYNKFLKRLYEKRVRKEGLQENGRQRLRSEDR